MSQWRINEKEHGIVFLGPGHAEQDFGGGTPQIEYQGGAE